jgi:hypothetical protein
MMYVLYIVHTICSGVNIQRGIMQDDNKFKYLMWFFASVVCVPMVCITILEIVTIIWGEQP